MVTQTNLHVDIYYRADLKSSSCLGVGSDQFENSIKDHRRSVEAHTVLATLTLNVTVMEGLVEKSKAAALRDFLPQKSIKNLTIDKKYFNLAARNITTQYSQSIVCDLEDPQDYEN